MDFLLIKNSNDEKQTIYTILYFSHTHTDLVCFTSFESETSRYLKLVTNLTDEDLRNLPLFSHSHGYSWWQTKCWGQFICSLFKIFG